MSGGPSHAPNLEELTDERLAEKCRGPDCEAYFRQLVKRHEARIFSYAFAKLGHYQEAEEVVQDSFIRIHRSLGRYDPSRPFPPWIHAIVSRTIARQWRYLGRWRKLLSVEPMDEASADDIDPSSSGNPDIWRLAAKILSHRDFSLLWLHYGEDQRLGEAALQLGISETAARTALHRSRKKLKSKLSSDPLGSALCLEHSTKTFP